MEQSGWTVKTFPRPEDYPQAGAFATRTMRARVRRLAAGNAVLPADPHATCRTERGRRTIAAYRAGAAEGRHMSTGHSLYGYTGVREIDVLTGRFPYAQLGQYLVVEEQALIVRIIFDEFLRSGSISDVVKLLSLRGTPTSDGKATWSNHVINRMLRNPAYAGSKAVGRTSTFKSDRLRRKVVPMPESSWIRVPCPPIVAEETWQAAQVMLREATTRQPRIASRKPHPLLEGMIYCGDCGLLMHAGSYPSTKTRGGGHLYACKSCKPTWNAKNSPRPKWCAYSSNTIVPAVRDALDPLLPEADRQLVLAYLFDPAWNVPTQARRKRLLLGCFSVRVFNEPFRVELAWPETEKHPKARDGLLRALVENVRLDASSQLYLDMMRMTTRHSGPSLAEELAKSGVKGQLDHTGKLE